MQHCFHFSQDGMPLWGFFLGLGLLFCVGLAIVAVLAMILKRRKLSQATPAPCPPPPEFAERAERISREIEKIDAMEAAGRINANEAAELKQALEGERREWLDKSSEFARTAGAACQEQLRKRFAKSRHRIIAGVCGGIADWLGWDATLVRILYLLLSLCSAAFPGFFIYLILWVIMPRPEAATDAAGSDAGLGKWLFFCLALVLAFFGFWFFVLPIIILGLFFLLPFILLCGLLCCLG